MEIGDNIEVEETGEDAATSRSRAANGSRRKNGRNGGWTSGSSNAANCSGVRSMSRTQRLTLERDTPSSRSISFIDQPSRRRRRASARSSVFISDNVPDRSDGVRAGAGNRTRVRRMETSCLTTRPRPRRNQD